MIMKKTYSDCSSALWRFAIKTRCNNRRLTSQVLEVPEFILRFRFQHTKKLTWFCFLFCADEQPGFRLTWISGAHLNCVNHFSWIKIMGRRGHVAMKMITDMITRLKCLVIPITQVFGYKPSEVNRVRTSNLREKVGVKFEHPVPHDHWLHCQCLILYPYFIFNRIM